MTQPTRFSDSQLTRQAAARVAIGFCALFAMLFLPAGSFAYWQAWAYLGTLFLPLLVFCVYLLRNDPELLARRMRVKEQQARQSLIVQIAGICVLLEILIPGFDRRFGWSQVPVAIVIIGDVMVAVGYATIARAMRENSYASRIVEVERSQRVVASGPYAIVRHPMYVGVIVMYLFTPLALGSWWALIPAVGLVPVLVARIRGEERTLASELSGYGEYMQAIRYRLIPGVW
jgi:protein-S-isoprenylcysteine O-methyltransferase Ste14